MKTYSIALQSHINKPLRNSGLATCIRLMRRDGNVYGFTTKDTRLIIGGIRYDPAASFNPKDIAANLNLDTDNTSAEAFLDSDTLTEDDLRAGRWDYAAYRIFQVNWADLTMGDKKDSTGHLGQVTVNRQTFVAELLGLMESYGTSIGEITTPGCRVNHLGDQRCKVKVTPPLWTALTGYVALNAFDASVGDVVSPTVYNGFFFYCGTPGTSGATEPAWATIIGAPTVDGSVVWTCGAALTVTGTIVSGDPDLFTLNDSGRTEADGFFGEGVITITSGIGAGLSYDIKQYTVGVMVTKTPLAYDFTGETYTMSAGCDKQLVTCSTRFFNTYNMRAEPWLRGPDAAIQIGRHG